MCEQFGAVAEVVWRFITVYKNLWDCFKRKGARQLLGVFCSVHFVPKSKVYKLLLRELENGKISMIFECKTRTLRTATVIFHVNEHLVVWLYDVGLFGRRDPLHVLGHFKRIYLEIYSI